MVKNNKGDLGFEQKLWLSPGLYPGDVLITMTGAKITTGWKKPMLIILGMEK